MGDIINGNKFVFGEGSRMINIQVNVANQAGDDQSNELNKELLAQAIVNCQQYFWANASYAVVFCICRDVYKMAPNKTAFEKMIEGLAYKKKRSFTCPSGTIANAFSDNPIYNEHISEWEKYNALERIIKLRDELLRELKL